MTERDDIHLSRRGAIKVGLGAAVAAQLIGMPTLAAEPKRGGFARFATNDGSQTDSLDPITWPGSFTGSALGGGMCNNLTELLPDRSVAGDLAQSFEGSDKSKKWIFKLKSGLSFHNGKSLTAEDVVASIRHHMGPNTKSPAKAILASVAEVKADDKTTVVFTLSESNPDLPYMLSDYHLPIMPAKADGAMDISAPIGSGPFVMERWTPGMPAKMKRNPNYHKPNRPYLDEVEFLPIADVTARTNALLTGEVQFANNLDIKTLSLLQRNPNVRVQRIPSLRHFAFDMNTQVAPFNNPDVRLALKYAIDREEIVSKVLLGNGTVGNDNNVAKSMKFWAETPPQYRYDVAKAKQHLQKAGLNSVTVDLSVANAAFPGAMDAALLFKDQAAKAGIVVNIVREPDDGYWSKVWRQKNFVGVDWYGRATVDWLYTTTLAKGAAWNDTKFDHARFNELLAQGRVETDDAKRAAIYAEMQQIVHDEGGMIIVAFASYINGVSNKLQHGEVGGIYPLDNFKLAERWWMA